MALIWERLAPVLAGPFAAFLVYLILAVFGVFETLGDPVRALTLLACIGFAVFTARAQLRRFKWPDRKDGERRVEDDSGISGRPYEGLKDTAQLGSEALWKAHQARLLQTLEGAKARRPKSAWADLDQYGLRISAIVVLLAGVFLAGDVARYRVEDAFSLRILSAGGQQAQIEYWIEPPAYTGRPVQYLRDRRTAEILEGSLVSARISGVNRSPIVRGAPFEIEPVSSDVHLVTLRPVESGSVSFNVGAFRDSLDLSVVNDLEPVLFIVDDPSGDAQGRLGLRFTVDDDYGIETYQLEYAALDPNGEPSGDRKTAEIAIGNISARNSEGVQEATIDLSRSLLAGQRAEVRLVAIDGAGQRGASEPLTLTLPQRVFLQPLARAIASERRNYLTVNQVYAAMPEGGSRLMLGEIMGEEPERRIERAPQQVQRLAMALDAVSDAPTAYFDDPILFVGMRTAMREVRRARSLNELSHIDEDLWQMALRAELGSLADAEQALAEAQRALSDAMARGADQIEMSALFDAYDLAVDRYMQALAREAAQEGRFADGSSMGSALNQDMIQELIDAIREATELGDTEGARRAMQQLAQLLANMQMTLTRGGEGSESQREQELQGALEELSDAISEQRSIMEETFQSEDSQANEEGEDGASGEDDAQNGQSTGSDDQTGADLDALAERQGALSDGVGSQRDDLSNQGSGEETERLEDALGAARRAMDEAEQALAAGDRDEALQNQDEALSALREAAREAAQQLEDERQANGNTQDGTDPLGRGEGGDGQDAFGEGELSNEADRQRARDVLEELRRRAAERGRSSEELEYIDRLLDRF